MTSIVMLLDSPHKAENTTNNVPETVNVRTSPKRRPSQPVSGCMMAAASVYELMAQVPSVGLTANVPAIAGIETLTMVMSSTSMNVAKLITMVSMTSVAPCSAGGAGPPGTVPADGALMAALALRRA